MDVAELEASALHRERMRVVRERDALREAARILRPKLADKGASGRIGGPPTWHIYLTDWELKAIERLLNEALGPED